MTQPTAPDLNAIEARVDAATPGPWGRYDDGTGLIDIAADLHDTGHGYRCRRYIGQLEAGQIDNDPTHHDWTQEQDRAQVHADAAFIAHARTDVPALAAEVRRLTDRINAVTGLLDQQELAARAFEVPLPEWVSAVRRAVQHDTPTRP